MKAGQTSFCHPSRQDPWGRHRVALPMPLAGHAGNSKLNKPIISSHFLEEFKEAASLRQKSPLRTRKMARGLQILPTWALPSDPPAVVCTS